jgi:endoglucanase
MKTTVYLLTIAFCNLFILSIAQNTSYDIRLNQVGYLPNAKKTVAIINTQSDSFKIATTDLSTIVFKGKCLPPAYYTSSGENVSIADFTLLQTPGEYVLVVDDLGKSFPFKVNKDAYNDVAKASIKAYYFNRASAHILNEYAGDYARGLGHPDTAVIVHPSAASPGRPAGTIISTPGGWYDAGDYNKYIVSSGISVFTLLSAYETYSGLYDTLQLNIPESNNSIPDILDETLWNIKWMMSMQDTDGGVYNKTTDANFGPSDMPSQYTTTPRYVAAKGTAATLDFAAIMAMTARIYKKYDPALADTALKQALKAWDWAKTNPNVEFLNPSASGGYPAITTGGYGDAGFDDEFTWCAAELYITTKDSTFYEEIDFEKSFGMPGWPVVRSLALLSLLVNKDSLTQIADIDLISAKLIELVSVTKNNLSVHPYRLPGDFYYWAGNNAFANWGMLFMQAFRLTGDASYYNAALSTLDYLLGKNATTYSFVTGIGTKSPMNIHHRISGSDTVVEPVPGLLVCGADPADVSDCGASQYPSTFPAKSYLDAYCSYSTNEVAIGINAPFAFLAGGLIYEYQNNFLDSLPRYFTVSKNKITLPSKTGNSIEVVVEGNTSWVLEPSADWINLSNTNGNGSTTVQINSKSANPDSTSRTGKIYVYSEGSLIDSILVSQNGVRKSFRIEFEEYIDMSGVQTETTADADGGMNLGYVDAGDWATYNIDVSYSGEYEVTFRHAGYAGNFDIYLDDSLLTNVKFSATADWQVWDSYTTQLTLTEGEHVLRIEFKSPGTNLNWMDFEWLSDNAINDITDLQVSVFPVPVNEHINIEFGSPINLAAIQLISIDGKIVLQKYIQNSSKESIDISSIDRGMYILKIESETNRFSGKIIVQ